MIRWIRAFVPAVPAAFAIGAAAGLVLGGRPAAVAAGSGLVLVSATAWFALAFLPRSRTLAFWSAVESPLLEHSWFRAFDEAGVAPPAVPSFAVSSEAAPVFVAWSSAGARPLLVISRSWLAARSEAEIRAAFREAAPALLARGLRWKTAQAWFIATVARRLPAGVRAALWDESGAAPSSPGQWAAALPWVAWTLWVLKACREPGESHEPAPEATTQDEPRDAGRRAAAALTTIGPAIRRKSILSFAL